MLNGSWQLKLLWLFIAGALILAWVVTIFAGVGVEGTMAATVGMLLGVIVFSINAAALIEDLFGRVGSERH
jgi:hypothetical protein